MNDSFTNRASLRTQLRAEQNRLHQVIAATMTFALGMYDPPCKLLKVVDFQNEVICYKTGRLVAKNMNKHVAKVSQVQ